MQQQYHGRQAAASCSAAATDEAGSNQSTAGNATHTNTSSLALRMLRLLTCALCVSVCGRRCLTRLRVTL
jgi:hypothetical protein